MPWLIYGGTAEIFAGIALSMAIADPNVMIVSLPGFALAIATAMLLCYGFVHCPRCGGDLGQICMGSGYRLRKQIRFCPYCGGTFDEELRLDY
jgi:hypothetical protein